MCNLCTPKKKEIDFLMISTFFSCREEYLNEWTVHIPKGLAAAQNFAQEHGFVVLGEVIPDSNHFHMKYPKLRSKRSIQPSHHVTKSILESSDDVFELEQQTVKSRVKRNDVTTTVEFNDPYWSKMWYLNRFVQIFIYFFYTKSILELTYLARL